MTSNVALPNGWKESPLGSLTEKGRGICYGVVQPGNPDKNGVRLVRGGDIRDGRISQELRTITQEISQQYQRTCLNGGEVLMCLVGFYVGEVARAGKELSGANLARQVALIALNDSVSHAYIEQYLRSPVGRSKVLHPCIGSAQPVVNIADLKKVPIALPPLPEQQKIAAILSTWDRAIELTEKLIAAKQKRKQALMQQLLTGKVRLLGFTEDWKSIRAGDLFKPISKKNHGDERVLSVTQDMGVVYRDELERKIGMNMDNTGGYKLVEPGNFVISLRSFQGGLEMSRLRGIVSPAYHVIRPAIPIDQEFFRHYFKSYEFIGRLSVAVIGIRDGKQISFEDFSFMKFHIPSVKEQAAISSVLNTAEKELAALNRKAAALKHQKKGLMQQLLTGKVRVNVDGETVKA